jgi:hypothetical protein
VLFCREGARQDHPDLTAATGDDHLRRFTTSAAERTAKQKNTVKVAGSAAALGSAFNRCFQTRQTPRNTRGGHS